MHRTHRLHRTTPPLTWLAAASSMLLACGSTPRTVRHVDTVVGHTEAHGAPRNLRYEVRAETERELIRLTVTERSECERLRMKVVQRVEETLEGDEVVARSAVQQRQVPDGTGGVAPCNERFARNVWVSLRIGAQTYRIGQPSPKGEVVANLAGELRQGLYADAAPGEATVVVDGIDAGTVPLASYTSHEARLDALLSEFRVIVEKDAPAITAAELTRAYELYARLRQLDSAGDARFQGLAARFVELVYQRKLDQVDERVKRNLKALNESRGLLTALSAGALPAYVVAAIQSGTASTDALLWARGEVALSLRGTASLCGTSPFTWSRVTQETSTPSARVAFSYLRFAHGDPFQGEIGALCGRLPAR